MAPSLYSVTAFLAIAIRVAAIILLALAIVPWRTTTPPGQETINMAPNRIWVDDGDSELTTDIWATDCGDVDSIAAVANRAYAPHFENVVRSDDCEALAHAFMSYLVSATLLTITMGLYIWLYKRFTKWMVWVGLLAAFWIAEFASAMVTVATLKEVAESKSVNSTDHMTLDDVSTGTWAFPVFLTVVAPAIFDYNLYRDRGGRASGVEL